MRSGLCSGTWPLAWCAGCKVNLSALRPSQVVYPCFGLRDSVASKIGLCKILRDIDPALCYVLPEDHGRVAKQMDGTQLWVSKRDTDPAVLTSRNSNGGVWVPEGKQEKWYNTNQFHGGNAVQFFTTPDQLPSLSHDAAVAVVVQPFFQPFLGKGCMARKWELRVAVAVVSIDPPRFYYYSKWEVNIARKLFDAAAHRADECVHDTHMIGVKGSCYEPCLVDIKGYPKDGHFNQANGTNGGGRMMAFSAYAAVAPMPSAAVAVLERRIHKLLAKVFYHRTTLEGLSSNPITTGIEASGASCFHWLRVDMGVSEALKPVIFEVNTNPETSTELGKAGPRYTSHRDLFRMLELDKPTRLPRAERKTWEQDNAGGWRPITPPPSVQIREIHST